MSSRFAFAGILLSLAGTVLSAQNTKEKADLRFRSVVVEGMTTVRELQKAHGRDGFEVILHLNRIDLEHVRQGATLVVPETPATMSVVSPFPTALGTGEHPPRLLIVSRRIQAFAA